jgi:glucose/arabinose dehydrogenase
VRHRTRRPGATPAAARQRGQSHLPERPEHHVLPNGDVLVAETAAPPRPEEKGLRAWAMRYFMKKAGAGSPSANRITLLRDTDGDGKADLRTTFIEQLNSPFGMVLVGEDFYVANTDAVLRFAWESTSGALWTTVNERDELGDDLVPDYMTSVQDGGWLARPTGWSDESSLPYRPSLTSPGNYFCELDTSPRSGIATWPGAAMRPGPFFAARAGAA